MLRRVGTVANEIVGTPVLLLGTVELEPTPHGTMQTYQGEIKTNLPPIAAALASGLLGAISDAAVAPVDTAMDLMEQAGRDWLAGKSGAQ